MSTAIDNGPEPTEPVEVVLSHASGRKQATKTEVRIGDARLWHALTHAQQDAAVAIERAMTVLTGGMGIRIAKLERLNFKGGARPEEVYAQMNIDYMEWGRRCGLARINADIVRDYCRGIGLERLASLKRMRRTTAREHLINGLQEYVEMKGWR